MKQPLSILACWGASDFEQFFEPAFCNRPEYKVEIVSGHRTSKRSPHALSLKRLFELKHRIQKREFDLIVCGNIWNSAWPGHKGFWTSVANATRFYTYKRGMLDTYWISQFASSAAGHTPIAAIDLRDSAFILPWDRPLLENATLYFKRELFFMPQRSLLYLQTTHGKEKMLKEVSKLRPFSYGAPPGFLNLPSRPMADRDIDLFISGGNNPLRVELKERSRKLASKWRVEINEGFLPEADYKEFLQRSKLVLCTESYGCETWRQYEVAGSGAVPLMNWPFTQNYSPFEPDRHAIYFSLIGDHFEKQIECALQHADLLQKISTQTHTFVQEKKDRKRLADYVIHTALDYAERNQ